MAGTRRGRIEMPGRLFRLAVRDLRAAAAAPEQQVVDLGGHEEAMDPPPPPPPPPGAFALAVRETGGTQEHSINLEESKIRRGESVGDEGEAPRKRWDDSVRSQAENSKKRPAYAVLAEATGKKRSCGSSLADTSGLFKGKPTWTGERTFSSSDELATGTSAGLRKSCKKQHQGTGGLMDMESLNMLNQMSTKAMDDDEHVSPDVAEKAKNHMAIVAFLDEMDAKYSLDSYRQRFALANGLPLPPPSWDRQPTPPVPSSPPPPIIEIRNYEEAKTAIRASKRGQHVHLQISQQLSLADAERISDVVMVAHAEPVILNLSVLETKASQAKFLLQRISHSEGEIKMYNNILALPWMPT